jgi:hypothetical protein
MRREEWKPAPFSPERGFIILRSEKCEQTVEMGGKSGSAEPNGTLEIKTGWVRHY